MKNVSKLWRLGQVDAQLLEKDWELSKNYLLTKWGSRQSGVQKSWCRATWRYMKWIHKWLIFVFSESTVLRPGLRGRRNSLQHEETQFFDCIFAKLKTCVRIEKIDRFGALLSTTTTCTTLLARGFQHSLTQISLTVRQATLAGLLTKRMASAKKQEMKPEETEETTLPSRNKHCKDAKRHRNRFQHWHRNCR